jgi:hypothetical protein
VALDYGLGRARIMGGLILGPIGGSLLGLWGKKIIFGVLERLIIVF